MRGIGGRNAITRSKMPEGTMFLSLLLFASATEWHGCIFPKWATPNSLYHKRGKSTVEGRQ